MAGTGTAVLVSVVADAWRRRELPQLAPVIWFFAALPLVFYVHLPSKHLVLLAPAGVLLIVIWSRPWKAGVRTAAAGIVCGGGLLLSLLIMSADARLVDLGRRAAGNFVAPHVEAGARVYYSCDWSSWYARSAGGRPQLGSVEEIERGDLIVSNTLGRKAAQRYMVKCIGKLTDRNPDGRIMFRGAGFFSNNWGYLPWTWGGWKVDRYELWKVL